MAAALYWLCLLGYEAGLPVRVARGGRLQSSDVWFGLGYALALATASLGAASLPLLRRRSEYLLDDLAAGVVCIEAVLALTVFGLGVALTAMLVPTSSWSPVTVARAVALGILTLAPAFAVPAAFVASMLLRSDESEGDNRAIHRMTTRGIPALTLVVLVLLVVDWL
jgi:hypothetical protein